MRENLRVRNSPDDYDRYTERFTARFDRGLLQRLGELYRGGGTLVDIGTGTAQVLVKIAREPRFDGLRLIGTELFDDMVERARETVRRAGLEERIEILQEDVHAMRLPDGFADYALSRSTIHHWAEPARALREIGRVLRPGGLALFHEPRKDPPTESLEAFNQAREEAGVGPTTLHEKYTPSELAGLLEQAGLLPWSELTAPESGPEAIGVEILIRKPPAAP